MMLRTNKLLIPRFLLVILALTLFACSTDSPITVINKPMIDCSKNYQVKGKDSLVRIANTCGFSVQQLADINQLYPPYQLMPDQVVQLTRHDKTIIRKRLPVSGATIADKTEKLKVVPYGRFTTRIPKKIPKNTQWTSPVNASIKQSFNLVKERLGIEFATRPNEVVYAIADGVVVYSGDRMLAHGKMIILKHANNFYSSYTKNNQLLVKDGQKINIGEPIAVTGNQSFRLEMRQRSKPINPADYIINL